MSDAMRDAARYRAKRDAANRTDAEDSTDAVGPTDVTDPASPSTLSAVGTAEFVETAIQVAIRQGAFDNLPGAGKPIEGLGAHHDPDWWIRRKIESENLTGLGPPALMLRAEDKRLDDELDQLGREEDVRSVVEDFNRRVIGARRQLLGGPPVVTKTRDVDGEVVAWRERRDARTAAADAGREDDMDAGERRRPWFLRRRKPTDR